MPMESPHNDNKPDMCLCMASMFTVWYQYKNIILILPGVVPSLKPIAVMFTGLTGARQYKNVKNV